MRERLQEQQYREPPSGRWGPHVLERWVYVVWGVRDDDAGMTQGIAEAIKRVLDYRCDRLEEVQLVEVAVGAWEVQMILRTRTTANLPVVVSDLKWSSSNSLRISDDAPPRPWERSFRWCPFAERFLPWVIDFMEKQAQLEAQGIRRRALRLDDPDTPQLTLGI